MTQLNPLAQNVVQSFNVLLREQIINPDQGIVLAGLMFEMGTLYKNRSLTTQGDPVTPLPSPQDVLENEIVVKNLLDTFGIPARVD